MIEKIGKHGFLHWSTPDHVVLKYLRLVKQNIENPVYYEIGIGVGATALEVAKELDNSGSMVLFSRLEEVAGVSQDLKNLGYTNIDARWGSSNHTFSGYHFELARAILSGAISKFHLAYLDGLHVMHLDAGTAAILKEHCNVNGYIIFDDYSWSLKDSVTLNPTVRPATLVEYDMRQIGSSHVEMICKLIMDTDKRFEFLGVHDDSAIYRRVE
jgi:hypothetical protein